MPQDYLTNPFAQGSGAGMGNIPFNSAGGPVTPGGQSGYTEQEEAQRKIVKQYLDAMHKLEQAKFNLQFPEPVKPKTAGKKEGGTALIGSIIEMLLKGKGDQTPLQFGPQYLNAFQQNAQEDAARQTMMGQQNYQRQQGLIGADIANAGRQAEFAQGEANRLGKERMDVLNQQQLLEIEKLRQGGREDLKQIDLDLRMVPDVTKDGPARAAAARRLVASGRAMYTPEYIAGLEQQPAISVQQLEQKKQMDAFQMDRWTTMTSLLKQAATDKHALSQLQIEMKKDEAEFLPEKLRLGQDQARANLKKTLQSIKESSARIDKMAQAAKTAKTSPSGKPMTATSFAKEVGTSLGQLGKAERELAQAESTQAYWQAQAEGLSRDDGFKIYDSKGNSYQGNAAKAIVDRMLSASGAEVKGYRAEIDRYKQRMDNAKTIFGQGQSSGVTLPPGVKKIK